MKKVAVTCAVLATLVPAPANAGVPEPHGDTCGFMSVTDPLAGPGTQFGTIDGGPLVVAELPVLSAGDPTLSWDLLGNPVSATLTCDIQLASDHPGAPDAVSVSATGTTVVTLPPTPISYHAPDGENVHLCTSVAVTDAHGGTGTFYWDAAEREWSTDPDAPCSGAIQPECCPFPFDDLNELLVEYVDPFACAVLDDVFPPEGDVDGLWDCPPYQL